MFNQNAVKARIIIIISVAIVGAVAYVLFGNTNTNIESESDTQQEQMSEESEEGDQLLNEGASISLLLDGEEVAVLSPNEIEVISTLVPDSDSKFEGQFMVSIRDLLQGYGISSGEQLLVTGGDNKTVELLWADLGTEGNELMLVEANTVNFKVVQEVNGKLPGTAKLLRIVTSIEVLSSQE